MSARIQIGFFIGLLALGMATHVQTAVAAPADTITCDSLQSKLSDDKNYYIFTARATGISTAITGYTFDFGDHQSYTFTFKSGAGQDHRSASVTHTYQKTGSYTPSVQVVTKDGNKTSKVTSGSCKTSVTIGDSAGVLPITGSSFPVAALFMGTVAAGTTAHYLIRRRKRL